MKLQRTLLLSLGTAVLLGAHSVRAAQVVAPDNGDIFLGVRASGGQGSGVSLLINIGDDTVFRNAASGLTVPLGNVNSALTSAFGSNWATRSDVAWGFFGARNQTNPAVYGSRAQQPVGTPASSFAAQDLTQRISTKNQIVSVVDAYRLLDQYGGNANAALQTNALNSGSYNFQVGSSGTTDFGSLSEWTSIEGDFGAGASGTVLDFFRYGGTTTVPEAKKLGSFNITGAGALTFISDGPFVVGTISLSSAVYSVDQGATTVALTVTRAGGAAPTSVSINTDNGTVSTLPPFAAAVAGTDYTDLAGGATTVSFGESENSKTVNVTLIPKTGTAIPNKRFTATLSDPTGTAATLGSISAATIQILANDVTAPTLTVTAPPAGTASVPTPNVSAPSPYTVKGIAGDAKGIDRVEVVLNGAPPVNATLDAATTNASRPYSLNITPVAGVNTVTITSFDLQGNTKSVTRSFNFVQRYLLSVARVAPVGIALDTAGTLTLTAAPTTAASTLAPATANANPKTSTIVPGTAVKLTATAKAGYTFSHWDGVPSGGSALGPILTFTTPSANVSTITAHFVANPFAGPVGSGNIFYGPIRPVSGTPSNNSTEGFFTATLTPASGAFTGKVLIDGVSQSFTGYFYGNGAGLFTIGTTKSYELSFGGRQLELAFGAGAITATVTHAAGTSLGIASRSIYSATNKVPAALLNQKVPASSAANNKGFFTIGFPSKAQDPVAPANTYPQGDGFGTITLSDNGTLSLSGTLADGTLVTGASGLVDGNNSFIFVQLTTPGAAAANKGGSFGGLLTFDAAQAETDVSGTDLLWFRPAVTAVATPAAAAAATNLYTAGWPNGIHVDAAGALYDKTLTVQQGLGLAAISSANAQLVFADGKLTSSVTKANLNITGNVVAKLPSTDASFTLTLAAATGGFNGTFTPNWASPNTTKPGYKGILIQKGPANKGGYGYFLSNAKNDLDPESGGVTLSKKPE